MSKIRVRSFDEPKHIVVDCFDEGFSSLNLFKEEALVRRIVIVHSLLLEQAMIVC